MSKKPMTWLELIKLKLSEEKAKGKAPSINDIMPLAKKEWAQIKEGKHPLYIQGKAQTFARKKKGEGKTRKNASATKSVSKSVSVSKSASSNADIQELLNEIKLCGKCKKSVEKYMKKKGMKGGNCGAMPPQTGGTCGAMPAQTGGNCGCGGMNGGCGSCVV